MESRERATPTWQTLSLHCSLQDDTEVFTRLQVKVKSLSHVLLFVTPWAVAYQAPPSMGFSRQAYWSGVPFPSLGDLLDPGIKSGSPAL